MLDSGRKLRVISACFMSIASYDRIMVIKNAANAQRLALCSLAQSKTVTTMQAWAAGSPPLPVLLFPVAFASLVPWA